MSHFAIRCVCALLVGFFSGAVLAGEPPRDRFASFLADREIDRERRRVLEEAGPWGDPQLRAVIRVLKRLDAPAAIEVPWRLRAMPPPRPPAVEDRLVRVTGRAVAVGVLPLTEEQAVLAGRASLDVVRITAANGLVVDVVVPAAPPSWPRWRPLADQAARAVAIGLPLATAPGPQPTAPAGEASWPAAPAGLTIAATAVGWEPPTPLGDLGVDYGSFATVTDGKKLEAGDTEAFYAVLAAVGRAAPAAIAAVAGKPADILPIIDPTKKWFAAHRGDPLTVAGIARRAVRIAVAEAWRQEQLGTDHYWELYVFVDTPLLQVNDRQQTDYPIVCCVRELPPDFPAGEAISERVTVSGFALKRYGYPLPDLDIHSSQGDTQTRGQRMETVLLIGRTVAWKPAASLAGATSALSWAFAGLAAVVGLVLAYGLWSLSRRDRRAALPDRIDLPGDRG